MASATELPGSVSASADINGVTAEKKNKAQFELGITLSIFLWPELSLAVKEEWGGPDSKEKREWFAQHTIDTLLEHPDEDAEWIEELLLNVMLDDFEMVEETGGAYVVAEQLVKLEKECKKGNFDLVRKLQAQWEAQKGKTSGAAFKDGGEIDAEVSDGEDEDGDVDMDEAPQLVQVRERAPPEVDEDGFTKVTKRR